jgi:chemotaxis protein CheD
MPVKTKDTNSSSHPPGTGLPVAPKGFEHINRYWDSQNKTYAAKIIPGEFYVSISSEIISTVLGSCVSACIWDAQVGVGGMNHFMLPKRSRHSSEAWGDTPVGAATRYGNVAMERLINAVLINGGKRENLEVKVFGGAKVLDIDSDVGQRNIDFVMAYLKAEGYPLEAYNVGGLLPRKIIFHPDSGRVRQKKLYKTHNQTLQEREQLYASQLEGQTIQGEVTLFDD